MKARPSASTMLRDFLADEAAGGIVLMAAALLAMIVAKSPLADIYGFSAAASSRPGRSSRPRSGR